MNKIVLGPFQDRNEAHKALELVRAGTHPDTHLGAVGHHPDAECRETEEGVVIFSTPDHDRQAATRQAAPADAAVIMQSLDDATLEKLADMLAERMQSARSKKGK